MPSLLRFLFCIAIITSISSCGIFNRLSTTEDFDSFYQKFNSNPTFQMKRIAFPIEGYHEDINGKEQWTEENWVLHKSGIGAVDESEYDITVQRDEDKYKEILKAHNGSLYFSRTFHKKHGKWYLTGCVNIEE